MQGQILKSDSEGTEAVSRKGEEYKIQDIRIFVWYLNRVVLCV
jgi:hypothetical protein